MYQLFCKQKINSDIESVWEFISDPRNLELITPDDMSFEIKTEHLSNKMYEGMMINYIVSPFPFYKTNWITEITKVKEHSYSIDEQRLGPYKIWHHEHRLTPIDGGVEMTDLISYLPPFGILGKIANTIFIKKRLNKIFDYRIKKIDEIFNNGIQNNS
ncbi:MAG: SRPBCC family protein [Sneathiellales bacterium]|nr:SRPBCC family protein [Sneathiellales bacterium]